MAGGGVRWRDRVCDGGGWRVGGGGGGRECKDRWREGEGDGEGEGGKRKVG